MISYFNKKSIIILIIFFCSLLVSFVVSIYFFYSPQPIYKLVTFNGLTLLKEILTRNIICFLWLLCGIISSEFLVYSFFITNGCMLGIFISKLENFKYILTILPHGILEIYSFLLLSCTVLDILKRNKVIKNDKKKILISFLLLVISAILESFLTPLIVVNFT